MLYKDVIMSKRSTDNTHQMAMGFLKPACFCDGSSEWWYRRPLNELSIVNVGFWFAHLDLSSSPFILRKRAGKNEFRGQNSFGCVLVVGDHEF